MSPRHLIPLLGMTLVLLAYAAPAGAVVGGTQVGDITDVPFQAGLLQNDPLSSTSQNQACGAVIVGPRRVVTAAHCVFDTDYSDPGQAARPVDVEVLAGTTSLVSGGQKLAVTGVAFDPRFDVDFDYDAAVLTLAEDIPANAESIEIAQPLTPFSPGDTALVSGWGATSKGTTPQASVYPDDLYSADVPLVSDSTCAADYADVPPPPDGATTVCAGDGDTDSCFGDSGGPLARAPAAGAPLDLIGLVSVGANTCADPAHPGIYTEAPADSIRSYLTGPHGDAPRSLTAPSVSGTAQVGSELACDHGTWSNAPTSYAFQWIQQRYGVEKPVTAMGGPDRYTATQQDEGARLRCDVKASSPDGFGLRSSAYSASVAPAPATPPSETPAPVPAPEPVPPAALRDTTAPVARILTARCVKRTCTLTLRVTDVGFSKGIAKVTGSVRSTYRRDGRTRSRTRSFTARRTASSRFTVKLTTLPVGTQRFALLALDKAGNRQRLPTRKTLRTKR